MQLARISVIKDKSFKLLVDDVNDKVIAPCLLENKIWEPMETKLVSQLLSEGQTVIDVGANIGYYTVLFSKIVGDGGKVFSFEPEGVNFSLLEENVSINNIKNAVLENKALSDSESSAFLYLSGHNKGDHRLAYVGDRKRVSVDCISLDKYLSAFAGEVHFLKSDTQGHELKVLHGMKALIQKNIHHLCCLLEFSPGLLENAEAGGLEAFLDFFEAYEAEIYWLKEKTGKTELVLVNKETLRKLAAVMLEHFEADYSRDVLIFFSPKARRKYFHQLGQA